MISQLEDVDRRIADQEAISRLDDASFSSHLKDTRAIFCQDVISAVRQCASDFAVVPLSAEMSQEEPKRRFYSALQQKCHLYSIQAQGDSCTWDEPTFC